MMSYAERLDIYNQNAEIAPDKFIERMANFERSVAELRKHQMAFKNAKTKECKSRQIIEVNKWEKRVDAFLWDMGYQDQTLF